MNETPETPQDVGQPKFEINDWKRHFTTVTPLSKALAMILFIALPFIGFWLGYQYGIEGQGGVTVVNQVSGRDSIGTPLTVFSTEFPLPISDDLSWYVDSSEVPEASLYVNSYNSATEIPPQTLSGTVWKTTQAVNCEEASALYKDEKSAEINSYLTEDGWRRDLVLKDITLQGLSADGPTGGVVGYVREKDGVAQAMYIDRQIIKSEPCTYNPEADEPQATWCPPWGGTCPFVYEYKVFLSDPIFLSDIIQVGGARLPNPASQNCIQLGGTLEMRTSKAGQYGVCLFEDNRQCEEWALLRGECPVGGMKVTGYENDAQVYCAITGGRVEGVGTETPMCKRIDGTYCNAQANLDGECPDPHDPNPSAGNVETP